MTLLLASMLVYFEHYHCATSCLDMLTSQQCKVVSTCSWRGSCGCLASRNGWWRYSQEDWLIIKGSGDVMCLTIDQLALWGYLDIWLDRLARLVGWKFPTPRNDSVKAFTLAPTCPYLLNCDIWFRMRPDRHLLSWANRYSLIILGLKWLINSRSSSILSASAFGKLQGT